MIVLFLSFATIIAYGYALGGLGSYAVGVPKPMPIVLGLSGGTIAAVAALLIWKKYLEEIEEENRKLQEQDKEEDDDESVCGGQE
ncbi:MAG: hypothetical protein Q4E17_04985 [Synergistes sp.]|nr:hypothetical protein [Synergistes sp.]